MIDEVIVARTTRWLERAVIGLNLCPFAKSVYVRQQVRYSVSEAATTDALMEDLQTELLFLRDADPHETDTTLLIHPCVLADFLEFNDFLNVADATLRELGLEGTIQIASFHPGYQFAGNEPDDIGNYTNRAPFPSLHLLREVSVARAVDAFPDTDAITARNIATLERLGHEGWKNLMQED